MKEPAAVVTVQPAATPVHEPPYLAAVARLQPRFPIVGKILDFARRPARLQSRVSVLEFGPQSALEVPIADLSGLQKRWAAGRDAASGLRGNLYVVEDLSPDHLEALGDHFRIHPAFFLKYLYLPIFTHGESTGTARRLPPEPAWTRKGHHKGLSLRYYDLLASEPRFLEAPGNVRRRSVLTQPFLKPKDEGLKSKEKGLQSILRNASLYMVPTAEGEPWIALLLVDRPADVRPYMAANLSTSTDFWSCDLFELERAAERKLHVEGLFDFVLTYWQHHATAADVAALHCRPGDALASFMANMLEPSWLAVLELVSGILSYNEYFTYEFEKINVYSTSEDVRGQLAYLLQGLSAINRARRRILWYIDHMRVNLQALNRSVGPRSGDNDDDNNERRRLPDPEEAEDGRGDGADLFRIILHQLQFAKERSESPIPVVIGACTILEAQEAAVESRYVNTLTYLAGLFLPLSVVSAILSMSDEYLPGRGAFWIFWVAVLPIMLLVVLVVYGFPWIQSQINDLRRLLKAHK